MGSYNTLKTPCPDCKGEVGFGIRTSDTPYIPSHFVMCKSCKRLFGAVEWGLIQKGIFATILKEHNFNEVAIEIMWQVMPKDKFGICHVFDETELREYVVNNIEKIKQHCAQKSEIPDGNVPC